MKKHTDRPDVYQIVTDRILAMLDQGVNPWRRPWTAAAYQPPRNLLSRKPYRGVNVLLLGMSPFESPYWLTYRQALAAGGHVKKGEHSSLAVFWKLYDKADPQPATPDGKKRIPVLRYYSVFNVEQTEGVPAPKVDAPRFTHDPIAAAQAIVDAMPNRPTIGHDDARRAFYRPDTDAVNMPPLDRFAKAAEYYSTLFHELAHATGHPSRLNRPREENQTYGTAAYGREELLAEMSSAFLCGRAGILDDTAENSAAYLDGWRALIKADRKAVVLAAGAAQKAVDYIMPPPAEPTATDTTTTEEEA